MEFNPSFRGPKNLKNKIGAVILSGAAVLGTAEIQGQGGRATRTNAGTMEQSRQPGDPAQNILNRITSIKTEATVFDGKPEFFQTITKNGDFSSEERKRRTVQLDNGSTVLQDVGMDFYKVRKGDTLSSIRASLSRLPEFAYLKDQPRKIESFNIPPLNLVKDMWIPIPLENKDRYLTDEQFTHYAGKAVEAMRSDERYGKFVNEILRRVTATELLATLVAIAKQEAGGQPIGRYELHRWEPLHKAFSFSLFHVLMNGPGLDARRHLNKSEGQLYHPQNACELAIAFIKEKGGDVQDLFPIDTHAENFARFYNGKAWRHTNPNYVRNISKYYRDAKEMIETMLEETRPHNRPTPAPVPPKAQPAPTVPISPSHPPVTKSPAPKTPAKPPIPAPRPARPEVEVPLHWERIGNNNLTVAVRNAHELYIKAHGGQKLFKTNQDLHILASEVSKYLLKKFKSSVYYPNEQVAVGRDKLGVFAKFRSLRQGRRLEEFIRID